ncbi:tetratricopeptide repeat protein [candidate division KSB1 bacterium]|nr:tetratricopeptide repeat protein [candidate division KSB1 bacterium]
MKSRVNRYLFILYLQLMKSFLRVKKLFYKLFLSIRKNVYLYLLVLKVMAPFSWKKRIALLEYQKKYAEVIDTCKKRLPGNPQTAALLYEIIARNLRNLDRPQEALKYIKKAREIRSCSGSLDYEEGLIYFIKKDYSKARQFLESAIKNDFDTAPLQIHLGKAYYQLGLSRRAEQCFRRVLKIYPKEGSIHFLLGIVLKNMERLDEAEAAFQKAILYGSDQREEHLGLAEIYTRRGEMDKAINEYKHILRIDPNSFVAHYFLGLIYEIQGDESAAISELIIANKINPEDEDTKQKLTRLLESNPK